MTVSDFSVTAGQYGRFLIAVFEEWVRHDVAETFVNMFDVALANWAGAPPSLCVFAPTCGMTLAMEHNGDMYSCDHFVSPDHFLGNISEVPMIEMVASPKQQKFGQDKLDSAAPLLPGVPGPLCLPRRMPQRPVHQDAEGGERD